jgi:hypothetical protein
VQLSQPLNRAEEANDSLNLAAVDWQERHINTLWELSAVCLDRAPAKPRQSMVDVDLASSDHARTRPLRYDLGNVNQHLFFSARLHCRVGVRCVVAPLLLHQVSTLLWIGVASSSAVSVDEYFNIHGFFQRFRTDQTSM